MLNSLSEKAIMAKIKAMYGRRLTQGDYGELLRRGTLSEIAFYLKTQTHYSGVFSGVQESMIHRGQLETLIDRRLFDEYIALLHFDFKRKSFFRHVLTRMEIRQIVSKIRYLNAGSFTDFIQDIPAALIEHAGFSIHELVSAENFEQVLHVLAKTPYKRVLAPLASKREVPEITACEIALMKYYYSYIESFISEDYSGDEAVELRKIFAIQADFFNISSIYRLKKFFNAADSEIESYFIRTVSQIGKRQWLKMIESPSADGIFEVLRSTPYKKYLDTEIITDIEHNRESITKRISKKYFSFTTSTPVVFVAFMALAEIEISNIFNIIEGIRYKLPVDDIQKLLV